jgi:hypothetical protein
MKHITEKRSPTISVVSSIVLEDDRGTFESHWTEIAERVMPVALCLCSPHEAAGYQTQGSEEHREVI